MKATRLLIQPHQGLVLGQLPALALGRCSLRFEDSNPEQPCHTEQAQELIHWLGLTASGISYSSDIFEACYERALEWVRTDRAYVCQLSPDQARIYRGGLNEPGRNSPYRERDACESLRLLEEMRQGQWPELAACLRARIDMTASNPHLRDPVLYRIRHIPHPRCGQAWCLYPMRDWARVVADWLEGIDFCLVDPDFEARRPLYLWLWSQLSSQSPPQFIRNSRYHDSRSLESLRAQGFTPAALRRWAQQAGQLEDFQRQEFLGSAPRRMAVLRPLRILLEEVAAGVTLYDFPDNPQPEQARWLQLSRQIFIEQDDFSFEPHPRRLYPGGTVRLRGLGPIHCYGLEGDTPLCRLQPEARPRVKLPWVEATTCQRAQVESSGQLFEACLEPALVRESRVVQFEGLGYFQPGSGVVAFRQLLPLKNPRTP